MEIYGKYCGVFRKAKGYEPNYRIMKDFLLLYLYAFLLNTQLRPKAVYNKTSFQAKVPSMTQTDKPLGDAGSTPCGCFREYIPFHKPILCKSCLCRHEFFLSFRQELAAFLRFLAYRMETHASPCTSLARNLTQEIHSEQFPALKHFHTDLLGLSVYQELIELKESFQHDR
jgi:hypothetical protein